MTNIETTKVLYIAGCGRSGSTILSRVIGHISGFFAAGDIHYIWDMSFPENHLCGCAKPFRECEFWNAVIEEAFGGTSRVDVEHIRALRRSIARVRHTPLAALPFLRTDAYRHKLDEYSGILSRLYATMKKISGSRVIVDSSKSAPDGFILGQISDIELYVVHLIRDSRAVAYSYQREKFRPEIYWRTEYTPRHSSIRAVKDWCVANILGHSLKYVSAKYMPVKYEDVFNQPRHWVSRIVTSVGEVWPDQEPFVSDTSVKLKANHTVLGNPNRFDQGLIEIRPDIEWQNKMTRSHRYLVTALTWPLLLTYGYFSNSV